jgi:hypothetical protein
MYMQGLQGTGNFSGGADSTYILFSPTLTYQGPLVYNITAYGPVGSYIQGSFTGTLVNGWEGTDYEIITGTFYIQRSN